MALGIGIALSDGSMCTIMGRQTTVPCRKSMVFTTEADWQKSVLIKVYEGQRLFANDNFELC